MAEELLRSLAISIPFCVLVSFVFSFVFSTNKKPESHRVPNKAGYYRIRTRTQIAYEHRLIAEKVLGRSLRPFEVVHHINGRPFDNRVENLCVMHKNAHDEYHRWYRWMLGEYGKHLLRETRIKKLKSTFGGIVLSEVADSRKLS